jgi:hypothetical protein
MKEYRAAAGVLIAKGRPVVDLCAAFASSFFQHSPQKGS